MDRRILEAYALLRSVVEEAGGAGSEAAEPAAAPWHQTHVHMPLETDEVSGTDMLGLWLPDLAAEAGTKRPGRAAPGRADLWDSYFRGAPEPAARAAPSEVMAALGTGLEPEMEAFPPGEEDEDPLDDRDAAAAVDGLYAFVHAIGRLDVEAAMACVAEGYRAVMGDREVDRAGLRLWLDALFDRLRRFDEVDAYLAEIPEPIAHPRGVLIHCVIQVDGRSHGAGGSKETLLLERLALLNRESDGAWTLDALASVEPAGL